MSKSSNGHPAIKALEDEIAAIEKAQDPTRKKIAELQSQLVEGQQVIARNRAAISLITGKTAPPAGPTRRSSRRSPGTPPEERESAIVSFVQSQPSGTTAKAISDALGISTNTLSQTLAPMFESGTLRSEGQRRGRRILLPTG
jgi:hypothetical protein